MNVVRKLNVTAATVANINARVSNENARRAEVNRRSTFINKLVAGGKSYADAVRAFDVAERKRKANESAQG